MADILGEELEEKIRVHSLIIVKYTLCCTGKNPNKLFGHDLIFSTHILNKMV